MTTDEELDAILAETHFALVAGEYADIIPMIPNTEIHAQIENYLNSAEAVALKARLRTLIGKERLEEVDDLTLLHNEDCEDISDRKAQIIKDYELEGDV